MYASSWLPIDFLWQRIPNSDSLPVSSRVGRQPDQVTQLLGIMITVSTATSLGASTPASNPEQRLAYCTQTGVVRIPSDCTLPAEDLRAGNFILFDARKAVGPCGGGIGKSCSWVATSVESLERLEQVKVLADQCQSKFVQYPEPRLTLVVKAIILRVSSTSNSAWLWNDLIGRIYVNPHAYKGGMRIFEAVEVMCQYTGQYEGEWGLDRTNRLYQYTDQSNCRCCLVGCGW